MKSPEPNWWNFPAGFEVPLDLHKVPAEGAAAQSLMETSLNAAVTEGEGSMHTAGRTRGKRGFHLNTEQRWLSHQMDGYSAF